MKFRSLLIPLGFLLPYLVALGYAGELEPLAPASDNKRLGPPPPFIQPIDQDYLMAFVRQVIEQRVRHDKRYEPVYIPIGLNDLKCSLAVTLRYRGLLIGMGESEALAAVDACRVAAESALAEAGEKKPIAEKRLDELGIEIELIGPRERIGTGWDDAQDLCRFLEPAVHGLAVRLNNQELLVRPSQLISLETFCRDAGQLDHECNRYLDAISNFHEKLGLLKKPPERDPKSVVFSRFRTMHLFQSAPGSEPVHLIAGMNLVLPAQVTHSSLAEAVKDLARYIRYRQNPTGFFAYEFLPGRDIYWPEQNWIRQAGTTWVLAVQARQCQDQASNKALRKAIEAFAKMVRPLGDRPDQAYVATPDHKHALGTTALFCLALIDAPDRDRYTDMRVSLLNAMAAMQQADGSFKTNFPPSISSSGQDYYPGEALLAIAKHYVLTREAKWRQVCDRALPFYTDYFRANRAPMFVGWQVQAWGQLARTTMLQKYADFVYEMSDFLAPMQIESPEPALAIYQGAFDVDGTGRGGISTAVYLEGFVEAARTAAALGDDQRAERYREIVRRATRFVMQLRFRPEEGFYVQSPRDVFGAVRNNPINPTLRIDHCQHALAALLGAMELIPEQTK